MADLIALRARLIALRADALRQLAEADAVEPGFLALLAGVNAALGALDDEAEQRVLDDATAAERLIVVGSGDGGIAVVAYKGSARCPASRSRRGAPSASRSA